MKLVSEMCIRDSMSMILSLREGEILGLQPGDLNFDAADGKVGDRAGQGGEGHNEHAGAHGLSLIHI